MADRAHGARWTLRAGFCILTVLALGTAAGEVAAGGVDPSGFTRYASCSPDGEHHTRPTHVCQEGDMVWAVARYGGTPFEYEVCVQLGRGQPDCSDPQSTVPGGSSIVTMPTKGFTGLVTVSWRAEGSEIGSYGMRFVKDPVVPAFGLSPLIVSGTHQLFGLVIRHIPPGLQVQAWRVCDGNCRLPLRLVARKGETRRYRIRGSRRNSTFAFGDVLYVIVTLPNQGKIWDRIYRGRLVRDRNGGPRDTAIRRIDPPLCAPPGFQGEFSKRCSKVRDNKVGTPESA